MYINYYMHVWVGTMTGTSAATYRYLHTYGPTQSHCTGRPEITYLKETLPRDECHYARDIARHGLYHWSSKTQNVTPENNRRLAFIDLSSHWKLPAAAVTCWFSYAWSFGGTADNNMVGQVIVHQVNLLQLILLPITICLGMIGRGFDYRALGKRPSSAPPFYYSIWRWLLRLHNNKSFL